MEKTREKKKTHQDSSKMQTSYIVKNLKKNIVTQLIGQSH